jgi:hypothetical protein
MMLPLLTPVLAFIDRASWVGPHRRLGAQAPHMMAPLLTPVLAFTIGSPQLVHVGAAEAGRPRNATGWRWSRDQRLHHPRLPAAARAGWAYAVTGWAKSGGSPWRTLCHTLFVKASGTRVLARDVANRQPQSRMDVVL